METKALFTIGMRPRPAGKQADLTNHAAASQNKNNQCSVVKDECSRPLFAGTVQLLEPSGLYGTLSFF